ncbi:ferredoxin [Candidatus Woesearchaeota archaeon CG11_big_fil_rev_8_21_14_0_20_43_8]|nr:MAG: ferredoxin [Candidatus Woesearchaeota archaeon CG11_big_fil_rev_8_21_14_0_20_43_8]PIO05558.1 MAG: ferredoxin III, nif-specific [Candidatus Woesearchaeota archaeon CG08_land_8_20_14_0_20_43_7]
MAELSIISLKVQTSITKAGKLWIPKYFLGCDEDKCISCGQCVQTCPRGVLKLDRIGTRIVSTISDPDNCIGCTACMNACKNQCIICAAKRL